MEPLNCPYCNAKLDESYIVYDEDGYSAVNCIDGCDMMGPAKPTEEEAIEAWNYLLRGEDEEITEAKLYAFQEKYWNTLFICEDCGWKGEAKDALVDTDISEPDQNTNNLYCPECFDIVSPA